MKRMPSHKVLGFVGKMREGGKMTEKVGSSGEWKIE